MNYSKQLRDRLEEDEILVTPDVHDPLSARIVEGTGRFDAVKLTGSGTTASYAGLPDAGLLTMTEMVDHGGRVQDAVDVPVIADADNGYGNATNVIRTVKEYIKAGVAGIHIEDQGFPKRNGDVKGVEVIPLEEALGKIRAAVDTRDEYDEEFVILARTDARRARGGTLEDAIERANAFSEAGADVVFVKAPHTREEAERIGREVDSKLLYPCSGPAPRLEPEELEEMGWDIVLYGRLVMSATITAIHEAVSRFDEEGVSVLEGLEDDLNELYPSVHHFAGMPQIVEWEEKYLPDDLDKYEETSGYDITTE